MIRKLFRMSLALFIGVSGVVALSAPAAMAESAIYSCDSLVVTQTGGNSVSARLGYTARNGAGMQMTRYDFGDGKVIGTHETVVTHTYAQPGTYTVKASMRIIVDNKRTINDVTSPACRTTVTVGQTATTTQTTSPQTSSTKSQPVSSTVTPASHVADTPSSVTVTELPKTGPADMLLGLVGMGLIIFLGITYVRQELKRATH